MTESMAAAVCLGACGVRPSIARVRGLLHACAVSRAGTIQRSICGTWVVAAVLGALSGYGPMDRFAQEALDTKLELIDAKCDSLAEAHQQLLACVSSLEARFESIKQATEPLEAETATVARLRALRRRLSDVDKSLSKSHARLKTVDARLRS